MPDSIPQLRKDIAGLQQQLIAARARIAELESLPPVTIVEKVPFETVRVEYRDRVADPVIKYVPDPELMATIRRLQERIKELGG